MEQFKRYRIFDLSLPYVLAYVVLCAVTAGAVIFTDNVLGFGEAEDFLVILILPLFYSSFYYNRCSFYILFVIAVTTCAVVLYFNDYHFFKSSMNTVLIYAAIIAVSRETIVALLKKHREAELEIQKRDRNYHEIFNGATESFFVHEGITGKIIDVNESTCNLFGYSKEEFLRLTVGDISSGDFEYNQEAALDRIHKALAGEPIIFEWRCKRRNDELFWIEVNLRRITLGEDECVLAVARDITDRKKVEEERDRSIEDLQNALREINQLKEIIPICSHCKKVRNDEGFWEQVESYIHDHYKTHLSHSICPDCAAKHYAEYLND